MTTSNNTPTAPQGQVPTTEAMTQVRALRLAALAIDYLLIGMPALDTFNPDELGNAFDLLFEMNRARVKRHGRRPAGQDVLDTARPALTKVYWQIWNDGLIAKRNPAGRMRPKLETAARRLPQIVAEIEAEYDAYWAEFATAALEEAVTLCEN